MSLYSYFESRNLATSDPNFDALIMAAIRKADSYNAVQLKAAFPHIYEEFHKRYNAPGGLLEGETGTYDQYFGDIDEDDE
jgi:hypothetical protein